MKRNLLVTLADEKYLEHAKQLFSSAYWNAGWKGDYMLIASGVPDAKLEWFKKKGILVKKVKPLYHPEMEISYKFTVVLDKLYLFKPEFKKWKNIIFLDSDIIVRARLDELAQVKDIWLPLGYELKKYFKDEDCNLYGELRNNYRIEGWGLNAGIIAFSSKIIRENTFNIGLKLLDKYGKICAIGDESVINLLFYKKWRALSYYYYNFDPQYPAFAGLHPKEIRSKIVHFMGEIKPWNMKSKFYNEYKANAKRAELIDLTSIPDGNVIKMPSRFFAYLDRLAGKIGILLKKYYPGLYVKIKSLRSETR